MEILWGIIIFLTELFQSYFADKRTVAIVMRKRTLSTIYDVIAEALGWGTLALIVVNRLFPPYIIAAILGNSLGTWLVAGRRLKKKKAKPKKKVNFTTA